MIALIPLILTAGLALQPAAPKPAAEPLPPVQAGLPDVNSVLTKLESADKDLTSLTAAVRLIKNKPAIEGGGMEVRYGTLKFTSGTDSTSKPLRRFAIGIDTETIEGKAFQNPGGMMREFIFDGHFLLETWPKQKQYVRRHIVGANSTKDPLRIGEGPFPIPVGQRKDDLLTRFTVSVAPSLETAPESDMLRRILIDCTQLKLIPKPGTDQAKAFSEIRLWYRTSDMLPIFAKTANVDGSSNEVFLDSIKRNPGVPDAAFSTDAPKKADGWNGEEQDLRDKVEIAPGDPAAATPAPKADPANSTKPSDPTPVTPK